MPLPTEGLFLTHRLLTFLHTEYTFYLTSRYHFVYPPRMAPTSFDISDVNDCFTVDPPVASCNDAFAVDEVLTPRASSSPELVMPQFFCTDKADMSLSDPDYDHQTPIPFHTERSPNPWDPRMIVDLALNIEPTSAILECYGIDQATYDHLCTVPSFRRDLAVTMRELRENGLSYAKKAAVQAESYLLDVDEMIQDKSVPSSTRLSAIQWVTKMGRLEPREEKADAGAANGTTVNLQINFAH